MSLQNEITYPYDIVLFDFDGTISNSFDLIIESRRVFLEKYGIKKTFEQLTKEHRSNGIYEEFCVNFGRRLEKKEFDEMYECFNDIQLKMIPDFLKLYPGMIEIISKIKSLGIPVGILTNRITPSLMDHLRFYKLHIYTPTECKVNKPDGACIDYILKDLHISDRKRILLVGDDEPDSTMGITAGIHTAIVPHSVHLDTIKTPPTFMLKTVDELFDICSKKDQSSKNINNNCKEEYEKTEKDICPKVSQESSI